MFSFAQKKQESVVGIDISTTAVKLLEVSIVNGRFRVERYATVPLPKNAVADKMIVDLELVGNAIARGRQLARPKTKFAAAAVAGSSVITKIIEMDSALSDEEREMQIRMDADQYIPYPLSEVNMDFEVAGESELSANKVKVLLAASRTENIDSRVDALEIGGFTAKVVDVEAYAIERACSLITGDLLGSPEIVAVFDMGHASTTLMVLYHGDIIYTREQAFGGLQLIEDVQRRYGLSYEDAMHSVVTSNLPDDFDSEILEPFIELAVQQITRSLQFFYSANKYNDVDHILLGGGCARITGLADAIQARLGNRVSIANPFLKMSFAAEVHPAQLELDAPALLVACGLALRSFD